MIPLGDDTLEDDSFHEYLETISKYYNIHTGTVQQDKNMPQLKFIEPKNQ